MMRALVIIIFVSVIFAACTVGCSGGGAYVQQEYFTSDEIEQGNKSLGEGVVIDFPDASSAPAWHEFVLGPYDTIMLKIYGLEQYSGEIPIRGDGYAFFPFIGEIEVAGLTLTDLRRKLHNLLTQYLKEPQVDVRSVRITSRRFFLLGQMKRPGAFSLERPISIVEAISMGSGPTEYGNLATSYLIRGGKVYDLNISAILNRGDFRTNIMVQDEDIIYVPDKRESIIYVMGKVRTPSTLVLDRPMTVMDAIAATGGFIPGAREEDVKLIRGGLRNPIVYSIDMDAIMEDGRYDILKAYELQPGDIIHVPNSVLGTWNEYLSEINPTLRTFIYDPLSGLIHYFAVERVLEERR